MNYPKPEILKPKNEAAPRYICVPGYKTQLEIKNQPGRPTLSGELFFDDEFEPKQKALIKKIIMFGIIGIAIFVLLPIIAKKFRK